MSAKPMGRPRLENPELKRSEVIRASARKAEHLFLESCAEQASRSLSSWLIDAALSRAVEQLDASNTTSLLSEIRQQVGDEAFDALKGRLARIASRTRPAFPPVDLPPGWKEAEAEWAMAYAVSDDGHDLRVYLDEDGVLTVETCQMAPAQAVAWALQRAREVCDP